MKIHFSTVTGGGGLHPRYTIYTLRLDHRFPTIPNPQRNAKRFHDTKFWSSKILQRPFPPRDPKKAIRTENGTGHFPRDHVGPPIHAQKTFPKKKERARNWTPHPKRNSKEKKAFSRSACTWLTLQCTLPVQPTTSERSLVVKCLSQVDPWVKSKLSECRFNWIRKACESTHGTEKSSWKSLQIWISFAGVRCAYLKFPPLPDSLHNREKFFKKKWRMVSIWHN